MKHILFAFLFILSACGPTSSNKSDAFKVPEGELDESNPQFEAAITQHMQVQDHVLGTLNQNESAKVNTPYRLGAVMFDLAVSIKGLLGQLTGKGNSAVTLIWKKETQENVFDEDHLDSSVPSNYQAWTENVAREFCQQNVCAQGEKPSEDVLRHVQGMWDWSMAGAHVEGKYPWQMERIRLDLQVDASGKVITDWAPVSIKAGAKLRLEWKQRPLQLKSSPPPSPMQMRLLMEIMDSLPLLDQEIRRENKLGYELRSVKIGLGINVTGEWEVVKPGINPTIYIYLKPLPRPPIATTSTRNHVSFKGFKTAGKMARYFLRSARKYVPMASNWSLTDIKIAFDVSAKRTFTLTSINSTRGIELHFTQKKKI